MKNNFVAKNSNKYNKAKVYTDRKKETKKGYMKHKGERNVPLSFNYLLFLVQPL